MGFKASVTVSKKREQLLGYTLAFFHDEGNKFRWNRDRSECGLILTSTIAAALR